MMHLTPTPHWPQWIEVERVGIVVTDRCSVCGRTRTRLREEK